MSELGEELARHGDEFDVWIVGADHKRRPVLDRHQSALAASTIASSCSSLTLEQRDAARDVVHVDRGELEPQLFAQRVDVELELGVGVEEPRATRRSGRSRSTRGCASESCERCAGATST